MGMQLIQFSIPVIMLREGEELVSYKNLNIIFTFLQ